MQENGQLDELDYSLVNALQIAPRASWKLIGEVLQVSPVTVARRWARLTEQGHAWVTAYCASPLMQTMPYVLVTVDCAAGSLLPVADALLDDPHAVTVAHTIGTSDLLVAIWIADLNMLSRYLLRRLNRVPGVISSQVSVATEMFVEGSRWRLGSLDTTQQQALSTRSRPRAGSPVLTPADRELVVALSENGRASFEELAARTQTSMSTVRRRLYRHLNNGTLVFRCELSHGIAGLPVEATLWIDVPPAQLRATAAELSRLAETRMCAAVIGSSNLVLTVWLGSVDRLQSLELEIALRAPGLRIARRLLTLRHIKLMGRVLDDDGRAKRAVPMDIWRDPDSLGLPKAAGPGLR